jgi:hypothetical protein
MNCKSFSTFFCHKKPTKINGGDEGFLFPPQDCNTLAKEVQKKGEPVPANIRIKNSSRAVVI